MNLLILCQMSQPKRHFGRGSWFHLNPWIIMTDKQKHFIGPSHERSNVIAKDRLWWDDGIGALLERCHNSAKKLSQTGAIAFAPQCGILNSVKSVESGQLQESRTLDGSTNVR